MAGRFVEIFARIGGPKGLPFIFREGLKGDANMVKAKVGGIVLGGFAGFLILSKAFGGVERMVANICNASKWKNYYKYGKDGDMVPPGYSVHKSADGEETNIGTGNKPVQAAQKGKSNPSAEAAGSVLGEVISKAISSAFGIDIKAKEASEGQEKASEEDKQEDICQGCCTDCKVEKCPYESMRNGGEITEWNEKHEPIAGRYPWNECEELHWSVESKDKPAVTTWAASTSLDHATNLNVDDILVPEKDDGDTDGDDILERFRKAAENNNNIVDENKE